MKHTFIFLLFLTILNFSCKEYPCDTATMNINIHGFSKSDIDSVIIRKYAKSTNFSTLIQSTSIDSLEASYSWVGVGDYLNIVPDFGNEYGLRSEFDYEIYIPRQNRIFKITEIVEEPKTGKETISMEKSRCMNNTKSYKVDGRLVSTPNTFYSVELIK
jgi:hypothetical protein